MGEVGEVGVDMVMRMIEQGPAGGLLPSRAVEYRDLHVGATLGAPQES
jgi:hypothetical protein